MLSQAEVQKVEDEFKKFETRDVKVREDLKHHKAAVKKLKEKHDKARERLRKATDSMEEAVEEKPKLDRRVAEIVKQVRGWKRYPRARPGPFGSLQGATMEGASGPIPDTSDTDPDMAQFPSMRTRL